MSETEETSEITAEEPENTTENTKEEKYLIFSIQNRYYTFPSRLIGEIALFDTVYPLPLMPAYVLGVINRYSIPYALFDISLLLFKTPSPHGKVLVLKDDFDRISFLIDEVIGIADIPQGELLSVEQSTDSEDVTEAVSASFSWNGSNVFVLDLGRILAHIKGA